MHLMYNVYLYSCLSNPFNQIYLPVIHLSMLKHMLSITDDGVKDLLSAEHLCLKQLHHKVKIKIFSCGFLINLFKPLKINYWWSQLV